MIGTAYIFFEYIATYFQYKKITVGKECVYLKYRVYTNDDPILFISTSKSRKINSSTDYLYEYSGGLFYQIRNDTLFVFCRELLDQPLDQPPKFNSKIVIIQKSLSNPEFMNLYDNYKTFGYERFP